MMKIILTILFLIGLILLTIYKFIEIDYQKEFKKFFDNWEDIEYIEWPLLYYGLSGEIVKIQSIKNDVIEYKKLNSDIKYYLSKKEFYLNYIRKEYE